MFKEKVVNKYSRFQKKQKKYFNNCVVLRERFGAAFEVSVGFTRSSRG